MNIIQDGLLDFTACDVKCTNATQQIGNLISVISETITACSRRCWPELITASPFPLLEKKSQSNLITTKVFFSIETPNLPLTTVRTIFATGCFKWGFKVHSWDRIFWILRPRNEWGQNSWHKSSGQPLKSHCCGWRALQIHIANMLHHTERKKIEVSTTPCWWEAVMTETFLRGRCGLWGGGR